MYALFTFVRIIKGSLTLNDCKAILEHRKCQNNCSTLSVDKYYQIKQNTERSNKLTRQVADSLDFKLTNYLL